jgi:hypothetical protein
MFVVSCFVCLKQTQYFLKYYPKTTGDQLLIINIFPAIGIQPSNVQGHLQ